MKLSKKKIIIIGGIVIFIILLILLLNSSKKQTTNSTLPAPTPNQSIDIEKYNAALKSAPDASAVKVVSTDPEDGTTGVSILTPIVIKFSTGIDEQYQQLFSINTSPDLQLEQVWSGRETLELNPGGPLKPNQKYTIAIFYKEEAIYEFSFTTKSEQLLNTEEQISIQAINDYNYGQGEKKFYEENPWLLNLPIITDQYTVTYDGQADIIIVNLLAAYDDATLEKIKTEVNAKLKSFSAPEKEMLWRNYY